MENVENCIVEQFVLQYLWNVMSLYTEISKFLEPAVKMSRYFPSCLQYLECNPVDQNDDEKTAEKHTIPARTWTQIQTAEVFAAVELPWHNFETPQNPNYIPWPFAQFPLHFNARTLEMFVVTGPCSRFDPYMKYRISFHCCFRLRAACTHFLTALLCTLSCSCSGVALALIADNRLHERKD